MRNAFEIADRLMATGPNGGGVALVTNRATALLREGDATGLAIGRTRLAWCLQGAGPSRIREFIDGSLRERRLCEDDLDLHDLLEDGDGWWTVATATNSVFRIEADGLHEHRRFSDVHDSWHLNSIARYRGELVASAFGRFSVHRGYKGASTGAGEVFRVEDGARVVGGLSQPHSLVEDGDSLWLCNSEVGEVLQVVNGEVVTRWLFPGYTRGLALGVRHAYVGLSLSRNEGAERGGQRFDSAVIAVVDRSDGRVEGFIGMPWREIYDLRVLTDTSMAEALLMAQLDEPSMRAAAAEIADREPPAALALTPLLDAMARQNGEVIHAISHEIHHMQATTAAAMRQLGTREGETALADSLALRLDTVDVLHADVSVLSSFLTEQVSRSIKELRDEADATRSDQARLASLTIGEIGDLRAEFNRQPLVLGEILDDNRKLLVESSAKSLEIALHALGQEVSSQMTAALAQTEGSLESAMSALRSEISDQVLAALAQTEQRTSAELHQLEEKLEYSQEFHHQVDDLCDKADALESELDDVYSSTSWVATRPLRLLKRLLTRPRSTLGQMGQALAAVASPTAGQSAQPGLIRRSLNLVRRTTSTGRLDPSDRARLRSMVRNGYSNAVQNLGLPAALARPTLSPPGEPADVFVWCVIDWHFRMQRPQHLAAAMAGKGHRVFYISNNFVDSSSAGFVVEALNDSGRLFQVNLNLHGAPQIYNDLATSTQVDAIRASLAELLAWTRTRRSISLVQHPYWIEPAQCLPNMRLVYDCMDHHGGFENNAASVLGGERQLVQRADLLIVTSQWLLDEMSSRTESITLIRNAADYEHFASRPEKVFVDGEKRKVIGYYGAIAEWFDVDLIGKVALDYPDALVLLVGRDTAGAQARLKHVSNVAFVGEVPYEELPFWLHGFDVCLLPFQVIPLTLATNPVKVYEYLSAGKPVVSVDVPEMMQFPGLVEVAGTAVAFSAAISRVLTDPPAQASLVRARQEFAASQTWGHRAADLDVALASIPEPRVSVIVLCFNNVEFTRACLDSLEKYSDYPNLEVIAVDNASSDETPVFLADWSAAAPNRVHIANSSNLGFSAGNNVGLGAATGDYLVILNNDTYVTPGWVRGLMVHLRRNSCTGIIGPVTNNIGNEARIEISYENMEEMIGYAGLHTRQKAGLSFPLATTAFFCVMMPRATYQLVGPMDESFGIGFFEDDDYCRRIEEVGLQVVCAEDVFIHHHLSASFNELGSAQKQTLFENNKAIYEAKWGPWAPHGYR